MAPNADGTFNLGKKVQLKKDFDDEMTRNLPARVVVKMDWKKGMGFCD